MTYQYTVLSHERGDYTDPAGRPEIVYRGPSEADAMASARAEAYAGKVVRVEVMRKSEVTT